MSPAGWRAVEFMALALDPCEREAVLGDLYEVRDGVWCSVRQVLGLAIRRELQCWRGWQAWVAVAIAIEGTLRLMGVSMWVSRAIELSQSLQLIAFRLLLMIAVSWIAGFAVGALSRRTLWVCAVTASCPVIYCMTKFHDGTLPRVSLLLFVAPAIWGVSKGMRSRVRLAR